MSVAGKRNPWRLTPEQRSWSHMIQRCTNPKQRGYENYGGRGIRVCDRWRKFRAFLEDMGPRPTPKHSLDRIDSDGHYEPSNTRWATVKEQARNTRANRTLTLNSKTQCLAAWADELHVHPKTIQSRLRMGWSVERSLTVRVAPQRGGRGRAAS